MVPGCGYWAGSRMSFEPTAQQRRAIEAPLGPVVVVTRGTLHGICLAVLRDFAERCGLRPGFGVADEEYQLGVLKRLRIPERRRAQVLGLFCLHRLQGRPLSERGTELLARYQERL